MSLEEIGAAVQPDTVLLPATGSDLMAGRSLKAHEPRSPGSLKPKCGSGRRDMQAIPRSFAIGQDFDWCQLCAGDSR